MALQAIKKKKEKEGKFKDSKKEEWEAWNYFC